MRCYVFLSDESLLMWRHYNTLNGSRLVSLTCIKAPGFWMVEHQLVSQKFHENIIVNVLSIT